MKLNWVEKTFINSPFRRVFQQKEANLMLQLGGGVEGGRVLEIGCGRGVGVEIILDTFKPSYVEAFDYDPAQADLAQKRLSGRYSDKVKIYSAGATEIPAPDACFDAVFDFGVLHHIPDNGAALKEIARVLKPGGRLYFMELMSSLTMNPVIQFLTRHPPEAQFSWDELSKKLNDAGFVFSDNEYRSGLTRVIGAAKSALKNN